MHDGARGGGIGDVGASACGKPAQHGVVDWIEMVERRTIGPTLRGAMIARKIGQDELAAPLACRGSRFARPSWCSSAKSTGPVPLTQDPLDNFVRFHNCLSEQRI
jgi:hypothetical protein